MNNFINNLLQKYINPTDLIKKYENLKQARSTWDLKWQIIQDQIYPDYRDYVNKSKSSTSSPSTSKIKNHCSAISGKINKIVSSICSQVCDPSVKWLHLKFGEEFFNQNFAAQKWLWECEEALYRLFASPDSGFYSSSFPFYLDWFSIGTGCREIILRKDTNKIHFSAIPMQYIFAETSGYGDIDTVFRRLNLTARQAQSIWGNNIHPTMYQYLRQDTSSLQKEWEFFEAVFPNPIRDKFPSLNFISVVIDKSNKHVLDIGLHSFPPYVVSRFFIAAGEVYGRSYVWNAMPDIKIANRLSKRFVQGIDYAVSPIVLVKDATSLPRAQITPGSFVQGLDSNGRPTFQQMPLSGDLPVGMEYYNAKLNEIDEALVIRDIFSPENPNMTATEVTERKIQYSNVIRPLIVRLEMEDLNKTILRTLKLLEQTGQLPPFPYEELQIDPEQLPDPILALRVSFSGQLARMQQMQEIANMDLIFQKGMQLMQVDPSVGDRINLDQLLAYQAQIYGVPKNVLNSDEVVNQIRESRQKQEEAQQQSQQESAMVENFLKLKEAGMDNYVSQ